MFFSFKADFKRPTNSMPVPNMARTPSVAISHKVDRFKPNLSKALKTSEKILTPVVVFFIHCSDRNSSELLVHSFYKYAQLCRVLHNGVASIKMFFTLSSSVTNITSKFIDAPCYRQTR